jgi:ABC-type multidrug transport system fused ATPase/permease subunit
MFLSKFGTLSFVFKYTKRRIWFFILGMIMLITLTLVALLPPYLTKLAFDKGIMARNMNVLIKYVLILVGTYLLQSILNYSSSVLFTFLNQHTLLDMKKDLNKNILNLPLEFFLQIPKRR